MNLKEINAFALPGGPMFVNRGMFDAAEGEGEVVGVMAHELAHVLLRHGTANATKAQNFQIGAIAGAIAGAIIGGGWGQAISQGSQFGLGAWLMKYSREYEKQADLLGAQIMARAGHDPRDLARMFEAIERQSKGNAAAVAQQPSQSRQPRAVHPAGSRKADDRSARQRRRLRRRQGALRGVAGGQVDGRHDAQWRGRGSGPPASVGTVGQPVPAPATRYKNAKGGELFQVSVPTNWTGVAGNNSVKFVPQNALGDYRGQSVFTHGVELGVARASSRNLADATNTFVNAVLQGNPGMRVAGAQQQVNISQRAGIGTPLVGPLGPQRDRTRGRLHDAALRRQPVLLPHGRARGRRAGVRARPSNAWARRSGSTTAERRSLPQSASADSPRLPQRSAQRRSRLWYTPVSCTAALAAASMPCKPRIAASRSKSSVRSASLRTMLCSQKNEQTRAPRRDRPHVVQARRRIEHEVAGGQLHACARRRCPPRRARRRRTRPAR